MVRYRETWFSCKPCMISSFIMEPIFVPLRCKQRLDDKSHKSDVLLFVISYFV